MSDIVLLKDGLTITPAWRDPRPEDYGKYAFIEAFPSDAPPRRLVRISDIDVDAYELTSQWLFEYEGKELVDLTSRVCVCERPSE